MIVTLTVIFASVASVFVLGSFSWSTVFTMSSASLDSALQNESSQDFFIGELHPNSID
jgi:hypothetical protein